MVKNNKSAATSSDNALFTKGEELKDTSLEALEKKTTPPPRFTEATFIAEVTKRGIGRPSTYATMLSTILDEKRGYCNLDNKKMIPTDLGMRLSDFLDNNFSNVISIKYTAELENELDLIANGKKDQITFLEDFYKNLNESINKVSPEEKEERICPECGNKLVIRRSKYGKCFFGCSNYPTCHHIENISK